METQVFFELGDGAFWLSVVVSVMGLAIIAGMLWFGLNIAPENYWDRGTPPLPDSASTADRQIVHDIVTDYRARRNEFWISFGQIVLAIFVVFILAALLITRTISAEAGLPILSGMSGYAIAKGISAGRTGRSAAPVG